MTGSQPKPLIDSNLQSFLFSRRIQQSAGSIDVLSTTCPYGCENAMISKIVAERLHSFVVNATKVNAWNLMESD